MDDRRATVLVVDDDPTMRALLRLHLGNAGYQVIEAADGVEGGYCVLRDSPDLLICDGNMPHMNGEELVTAIKMDPQTRHLPVVFLTVDPDADDKARRLGAVACLRKPVTADRLLEVVALFACPPSEYGQEGL